MTALVADRDTHRRKASAPTSILAGVDILYKGAMAILNSSGHAVAGADTANSRFGGVVDKQVDNSAGTAGGTSVLVYTDGEHKFVASGLVAADLGKEVYITDDQTVQLALPGTGNVGCGRIAEFVSATEVWVDIAAARTFDTISGALVAEASPAGGGMISIANPYGEEVFIADVFVDVSTPSTGAATADVGVAADGTTTADTLIDGVDIGTAAIEANNIDNKGTNGGRLKAWGTTQFITGTASADSSGLVGTYKITVLMPTAKE